MIIALAGRRIDAHGAAPARFPEKNIPLVKKRLTDFFYNEQVTALVSSASCGVDLIALEIVAGMDIPVKIILPSDRETFKKTSVTDRPGEWGSLYDRLIHQPSNFEVKELQLEDVQGSSYNETNVFILDEAQRMSSSQKSAAPVVALIVWEGKPKPEDDYTAGFAREAHTRNIMVKEILTV